jgi:outer membrane protein assembly factor BamB
MKRKWSLLLAVTAALLLAGPVAAETYWTHRGNTSARNSVGTGWAPALVAPRFVVNGGRTLVGQSAPVVGGGKVFVYARNVAGNGNEVLAFSEADGSLVWSQTVGTASWDSRSAPTVDLARGLVLIGSNTKITAMNLNTGAIVWERTPGAKPFVNSSVCIGGTQAFLVDYSSYGTGSNLWSLYLAPSGPAGQVAWSQAITQALGSEAAIDASGNLVVTDFSGYLRQFTQAGATGWVFGIPGAGHYTGPGQPPTPRGGFAGGPVVTGGRVYAATYNTNATMGENNSLLVCIDATTGQQVWSVNAERTDTAPVVSGSLVILSAGLDDFGSQAKVQAFDQATGALLWQWYGAGGWTVQPLAVGNVLYVGALSPTGSTNTPCTDLYAVDLTKLPTDAGFVLGHYAGAGSSPAYANGNIYTIGADGLHAFGPLGDINGDGTVTGADRVLLNRRLAGLDVGGLPDKVFDLNGDGVVNEADRTLLNQILNVQPIP